MSEKKNIIAEFIYILQNHCTGDLKAKKQ